MKRIPLFVAIALSAALACMPADSFAQKKANRPKVGLVLGGGGAKGAAEVGVLKYIEKAGIPIDYIAGTSIGSIIGGLYSVGYRADDLDSLFHNQQWLDLLADRNQDLRNKVLEKKDGVTYVLGFPIHRDKAEAEEDHTKTVGLIHGDNVVEMLDSMISAKGKKIANTTDFDRLPIPFHAVAVNIRNMEEVELKSGSLAQSMRASMAIPGIFKPIELDSMLLVDGGLINNLPVDVVRRMGADIVIAIDLTQNKRKAKDAEMTENNPTFLTLLEWVVNRPDLQKYNDNTQDADIYINPNLKGFKASNFTPKKIDDMIRQGEKAGKDAEKELKALKKKLK